jgi:hypothetical protein
MSIGILYTMYVVMAKHINNVFEVTLNVAAREYTMLKVSFAVPVPYFV